MNRIRMLIIFLLALAFLVAMAQSDRALQHKRVERKISSEVKLRPTDILKTTAFSGSRQTYQMVTDVVGGFGGKSQSDNYAIPVNSGGQPSTGGICYGHSFVMRAGFVWASQVSVGDANADGIVDIGDVVYLVNYLYRAGSEPCPIEAGDVTCDGIVNVGDVVFLISYLYKGGPPPAC